MARATWTEEQKQKALAIAEASTVREASKQTGIPLATIGRWIGQTKRNGTNGTNGTEQTEQAERNGTPKKIKAIAEEAVAEAKQAVQEYVTDKTKELADRMLEAVALAIEHIIRTIERGPNEEEPRAGWLKANVGALDYLIKNNLLLLGKPTSRQAVEGEMKTVYEQRYHIIQELINNNPQLVDTIFGRRMAERSSTGQS